MSFVVYLNHITASITSGRHECSDQFARWAEKLCKKPFPACCVRRVGVESCEVNGGLSRELMIGYQIRDLSWQIYSKSVWTLGISFHYNVQVRLVFAVWRLGGGLWSSLDKRCWSEEVPVCPDCEDDWLRRLRLLSASQVQLMARRQLRWRKSHGVYDPGNAIVIVLMTLSVCNSNV